ncbi:unnamed protein product [Discula destructiva]
MPITHRTSHQPARRDSWPPTQLPLYRSIEADDNTKMDHDGSLIDEDPINSFLSPTPLLDDGDTDDEMDMDMVFDAGIESSSRPIPIIRNISPSSLTSGLRPPPPRTPTPPHLRRFGSHSPPSRNSLEVSTPNTDISAANYNNNNDDDIDDDDGEDYVRLSPSHPGFFRLALPSHNNLGSSKSLGSNPMSKSAAVAAAKAEEIEEDRVALMMARGSSYNDDDELMPSPVFHVGRPKMGTASRGRSTRPAPLVLSARPRSWSGAGGYGSGRLSPRAWREPSPDVWSIEEEDEAEISEMDLDAPAKGSRRERRGKGKKVRFALPVREDIP